MVVSPRGAHKLDDEAEQEEGKEGGEHAPRVPAEFGVRRRVQALHEQGEGRACARAVRARRCLDLGEQRRACLGLPVGNFRGARHRWVAAIETKIQLQKHVTNYF